MLPHKLYRGKQAMDRLKVFEGIPPPYDKDKRMVVPSALKVLRLKARRRVSYHWWVITGEWLLVCDTGCLESVSQPNARW